MVSRFDFSDGSFLTHNSIRKFGGIKFFNKEGLQENLSKLGIEPLDDGFTLQSFKEILTKKLTMNVKSLLMDQGIIVGIGNIYAQEILYLSGISPLRKVSSLSSSEIRKLYEDLRKILKSAIKHQGSTVDNYSNLEGKGNFQNYHNVYNKVVCKMGHKLIKVVINGRGTTYCPDCQK